MVETRFSPWLCHRCGYHIDAASGAFNDKARPGQGDVAVCLNCGSPAILEKQRWRPMTANDAARMAPHLRRQLARVQAEHAVAKAVGIIGDLTKRYGRA